MYELCYKTITANDDREIMVFKTFYGDYYSILDFNTPCIDFISIKYSIYVYVSILYKRQHKMCLMCIIYSFWCFDIGEPIRTIKLYMFVR